MTFLDVIAGVDGQARWVAPAVGDVAAGQVAGVSEPMAECLPPRERRHRESSAAILKSEREVLETAV